MDRFKGFLIVLWIAGCPAGGGGGSGGDAGMHGDGQAGDGQGAHDAGIDAQWQTATNDHCANAIAISINNMHADIAASTTGATADLAPPCGSAGTPDVFFKFTLTRREVVYADTFGAAADTALYFASSCTTARTDVTTPSDAVCSTGACGTSQSQVAALLDPGTHYLVLATQGGATIHFQHTEIGNGTLDYLPQGSSAPTGTTSGNGLLYACEAGGAENSYWWKTCPADAGGQFLASTCTGTLFDTILSLQMPGSEGTVCDEDSCSTQSAVGANIPAGAGLYVVTVDGFSQAKQGDYTLTVSRP